MQIGVTGGGGFIGRALVNELMERGHAVFVTDERAVECTQHYLGRASDVELPNWFKACDHIYHLEWSGSFRKAAENPATTREKNLSTLDKVLSLSLPTIFSSTSLVYGGNLAHPAKEDEDVAPRAPYGQQKLEAERLIRDAGGCAVRVFNIYGPNSTDPNQIIPRLLAAAKGDRQVRLNGDGLQQRDFVHLSDAAKALANLVDVDSSGQVLNLSSGVGTSMVDLVSSVFETAGVEPEISWNPVVPGEARMICGDPTALKRLTNWQPKTQLRDGIRTLLDQAS